MPTKEAIQEEVQKIPVVNETQVEVEKIPVAEDVIYDDQLKFQILSNEAHEVKNIPIIDFVMPVGFLEPTLSCHHFF